MKDDIQARLDFTHRVMDGAYTRAEAEAELDRMEAKYGEEAFLPGAAVRKPRPWTRQDLEDLKAAAVAGAGSREFLSYMAEMGEAVHRKERRSRQLKTVGSIAAIAAAAAMIVMIVRILRG